jgi:hypothetical protein
VATQWRASQMLVHRSLAKPFAALGAAGVAETQGRGANPQTTERKCPSVVHRPPLVARLGSPKMPGRITAGCACDRPAPMRVEAGSPKPKLKIGAWLCQHACYSTRRLGRPVIGLEREDDADGFRREFVR